MDFGNFDSLKSSNYLIIVLTTENTDNCIKFDEKFLKFLDKQAPLKRKLLRADHLSCVSKDLRKPIMTRFYLEKKDFKNRNENSFRAFKKQNRFCSKLYKNEI